MQERKIRHVEMLNPMSPTMRTKSYRIIFSISFVPNQPSGLTPNRTKFCKAKKKTKKKTSELELRRGRKGLWLTFEDEGYAFSRF